jgi:ABC-2 type transport system permease protein
MSKSTHLAGARFAVALVSTTVRASFALRQAFWVSAGFMLINNLLFFSTWWILLERFEHVEGWTLRDIMCLFGVSAAGYGVAVILAGGLFDLARKVHDGELDTWLTQPKSVIVQALGSRTQMSGWGDLVSGAGMLALSGSVSWQSLPLALIGVGCASATFVACGVAAHSLAFWLGRTHELSRAVFEFTVTFSLYPPSLFGPRLKWLLFTVLPAGFVSYLPVELLRAPSALMLLACVLGTGAYFSAALWMFERGLCRYASGSRFSPRT